MTALQENALALDAEPVHFPAIHYLFVEKRGSIPANAPQAWNELHASLAAIVSQNTVTGFLSLYHIEEGIYRAGVSVAAPPPQVPEGIRYEPFAGGKYRKFVLRGPYSQLGAATAQAVQTIRELRLPLRNDFNIENYVNDPRTTSEEQLITEILFPIA